jgi:glycosyltransferase involved in cell wall biosynthesis
MPAILTLATVPITLTGFLLPFANHFRTMGWRMDAGAADATSNHRLSREFDHVYDIPWSRKAFHASNLTRACPRVREIVLGGSYDLVHVHTPIAAFLTRFALRRIRPRVKVLYTAHGFHFGYSKKSPFRSPFFYFEKLAGKWTDGLIVINQQDLETARRYRLTPAEKTFHSPGIGVDLKTYNRSNIDPSEIRNVRNKLGIAPQDFFLLMIAEFNPGKRHHDLMEAFGRVDRPDIHIVFAGDGLLMERAKQTAKALRHGEHIHFLGFRDDIPHLIAAADATILPSEREGLPRSTMESMALETLTAGARIRGILELLSNDCGLLFEAGNISEIARTIALAASDRDTGQRLVRNARKKIENYSLSNVLALHERIYSRMLADSSIGAF